MMAEINHNSPKATIRWQMACDETKTFVITLEEFLFCGFHTRSEAEFRAMLFNMGTIEPKSREEIRQLNQSRAGRTARACEKATAMEVTEARAAYARAAAGKH